MVDLLILVWLAGAGREGYKKGLYRSAMELTAFSGGLLLGLTYHNALSNITHGLLGLPIGIANLLGFTLIFLLSIILFFIITEPLSHWLSPRIQTLYHYVWYRFLGAATETLKAALLTAVVLAVIVHFPVSSYIREAVKNSDLGGYLLSKAGAYENQLKKVFVSSAEEGILFNTVSEARQNDPPRPGRPPNKYLKRLPGQERDMYRLLNKERAKHGLPLLAYDEELSDVAAKHSLDMYRSNYFDHISPDGDDLANRLNRGNISFTFAGENLALAGSLNTAHRGLMGSKGHRANILDPRFNKIGIGIIDAGPFQQMTTQNFTN